MNTAQHRNWLLTILQLRAPLILWLLFGVVLIAAILTLVLSPIYSASTLLVMDSEISRVLGGLNTSLPTTSNNDFIRYEFFASHSVQLMRMPQLGEKVIKKLGLHGRLGHELYPEYFLEPNIFKLVYSNEGQGIGVHWIADTQTFMISGYSRDPDMAITLSKEYADAFLQENANQFRGTALKLLERTNIQMQDLSVEIEGADQEIRDIGEKYKTADPVAEISALIDKIDSTKALIEGEEVNEALYGTRMEYYKQQEDALSELKRIEEVFANNTTIDEIKSEIRQLQEILISQVVDLTPDHPDYRQTQDKLNLAQQELKKEALKRFSEETVTVHPLVDTMTRTLIDLRIGHLSSEIQLDYFNKLLAAMDKRRTELLAANTEMINLQSKKNAMISTLQLTLGDKYRLENLLQTPVPFFRVISSPRINKDKLGEYKYFPKRKKIVIITALVAGFLLFFFFVGKELIDNRAYYSWQLDCANKAFDCADLPRLNKAGLSRNPDSIHGYIRDIYSSLRNSGIVRISSRYCGEGKATIAGALAWYYKRIGAPTILVDGDIVNRSLSRNFGAGDKPGLFDVLAGTEQLDVCVVEVQPGIYLLPAGVSINASFSAQKCRETMSQLTAGYERMIYVDTPFDSDNAILSDYIPQNDTIMVAQSGKHSVFELEQAVEKRRFNNENSAVRWIVINKIARAINFFSVRDLLAMVVYPIRMAKSLF